MSVNLYTSPMDAIWVWMNYRLLGREFFVSYMVVYLEVASGPPRSSPSRADRYKWSDFCLYLMAFLKVGFHLGLVKTPKSVE